MEKKVAQHIADLVNEKRPEYQAILVPSSGYTKVSLTDDHGDHAIARVRWTSKSQWFAINGICLSKESRNNPIFDGINKNKNMMEIKISQMSDVDPYKDYLIEIADSLWKTYKIFKYRTGSKSIISSSGIGIQINFPT